jgi:hypothetical protein
MNRALAIIDFEASNRGGHFREWPSKIASTIRKNVDFIGIYTCGYSSIPVEVCQDFAENDAPDIALFDLDSILLKSQRELPKTQILDLICMHLSNYCFCNQVAAFVMWSFDLLDNKKCSPHVPWSGIGVVSAFARGIQTVSFSAEKNLLDFCESENSCRSLLVWDEYAVKTINSDKLKYLPDIEDVDVQMPSGVFVLPFKLGLVGVLWGYRGVNLLCDILAVNPSVQGELFGTPHFESYSENTKKVLLESNRWSNKKLSYIESNSELNKSIMGLDALVMDAMSYPPPSGIAIRALAMGKCLIVNRGASWLNDIIHEHECGFILDHIPDNIAEQIECFYKNGGSLKSINAAKTLLSKSHFQHVISNAVEDLFS